MLREVLRLAPLAQDDGAARGILLLRALFADVKGASLMRFEMLAKPARQGGVFAVERVVLTYVASSSG